MDPAPSSPAVRIGPSAIDGSGAFAVRHLDAGTRVLEYLGERVTKEESRRRCAAGNPYLFCLDDTHDLDGSVDGNPARFLNHSCQPNCEAVRIDGRIWLVAQRQIAPGEELTFNYGYDLTDWRSHPCRCGTPGCVGYMVSEEFFPQLRRLRQYLESRENGGDSGQAAPES